MSPRRAIKVLPPLQRDALVEQMVHTVMLQLCDAVDLVAGQHNLCAIEVWRMQQDVLQRAETQVAVRIMRLEGEGR